MKPIKFVVLACGVLGLISFFLPFVHVKTKKFDAKASAFQIIKGLDEAVDKVSDAADEVGKYSKDVRRKSKEVKEGADAMAGAAKAILYGAFAPLLFLILFGGLGVIKRFGRGYAIGSAVFALIGLLIWLAFKSVGGEAAADPFGIGFTLLGAAYGIAFVASIVGAVKPEVEAAAAPAAAQPPA
jgi:hypothetical protein